MAEVLDLSSPLPVVIVEARWQALCKALKMDRESCRKWWTVIRDHYSESWRHYHTLSHVLNMLELLDTHCRIQLGNVWEVELTIFFHEYILS